MDYLYLWDIEYRVLSEMQFKFLHVKFSFFFFFFGHTTWLVGS